MKGLKEVGRRDDNGEIVVRIDPRYFRPAEVDNLLGIPVELGRNLDGLLLQV